MLLKIEVLQISDLRYCDVLWKSFSTRGVLRAYTHLLGPI